jgi:DNA-binding XRE family transcriptional regulator
MAGHRKFSELRALQSPERRARNQAAGEAMLRELPLAELRHVREMTQAQLAEALDTSQSEISRMEKRADMYVSTLRSYIEGLGGTLAIVVYLPGGDAIEITQFHEIGEERAARPKRRRAAAAG